MKMNIIVVFQLQTSMEQMLSLLQHQQQEMTVLKEELGQQKHTVTVIETLQSQMDNLQVALETKVTGALSQHSHTESILLHMLTLQ